MHNVPTIQPLYLGVLRDKIWDESLHPVSVCTITESQVVGKANTEDVSNFERLRLSNKDRIVVSNDQALS